MLKRKINLVIIFKVILTFLILFFILSPMFRYFSLNSSYYDLGLFLNLFYKFQFFRDWQNIFFGHFQPLIIPISFYVQLFPYYLAPYALLFMQSLILLISIYLIKVNFGNFVALVTFIYFPLWANNFFDFHFDVFVILIHTIFFIYCKRKEYWKATFAILSISLIKEIFCYQIIFSGVYFLCLFNKETDIKIKRKLLFLSISLIIFGTFVSFFITNYLIPYFSGFDLISSNNTSFGWLGGSYLEIFQNLIFHPLTSLNYIFTDIQKLKYFLILFGLLLFIPLLKPLKMILAFPILLISFLAVNNPNLYSYTSHYTAGLIIPIALSFNDSFLFLDRKFDNLKRNTFSLKKLDLRKVVFTLIFIVHSLISFDPLSRFFWTKKIKEYSYISYSKNSLDRISTIKNSIYEFIPKNRNITISTQNSINFSYLAYKYRYASFPNGATIPIVEEDKSQIELSGLANFILYKKRIPIIYRNVYSDYLIIDLKSPPFIIDKGCDYVYSSCLDKEIQYKFDDELRNTMKIFNIIYEYDNFMILKRK